MAAILLGSTVVIATLVADAAPAAAALPGVGNGDYMFSGLAGKCMDIAWGDSTTGTGVNLFTCNGTPAQQWHFDASSRTITALGKCLDVPYAQFSDGNHLWIWDCNGTDAQRFEVVAGDLGYIIRPIAARNLCVDVSGGATDDWTPIQVYTCNGTAAQQWHAADQQSPYAAPVAPIMSLGTMTVRDHRGGTTVTRTVADAQMRDRSLFEDGYDWYQRVNGGDWTLWQSRGALSGVDGSDFAYPAADDANVYEYKVVVHNSAGSTESAVVGLPPNAPTQITGSFVGPNTLVVAWFDNSLNESGFRFSFSSSQNPPGNFSFDVAPNTSSVTLGVTRIPGNSYCFAVSAFNALAFSAPSVNCLFVTS
jgi:hypothetical protein